MPAAGAAARAKGSLFDPGEVEELARRGRPRRPPGLAGLVIESGVTEIADDRLWFRGLDALDLARDWDFEDVCELLWVRPRSAGRIRGPVLARSRPGRGGVAGDARGASRRARRRRRRSRRAPSRWNGSR